MAFVATGSSAEQINQSTVTIPITLASVTRGVLVISVNDRNSTNGVFSTISSIVWNGSETATLAKSQQSTTGTRKCTSNIYIIKAPTAGTHNLVITFTGSINWWIANYIHWDTIDQTSTVNTTGGTSFSDVQGSPWTQALTTTVDSAPIILSSYNASDTATFANNSETVAVNTAVNSNGDHPIVLYKTAGTAGALTTGVNNAGVGPDEASLAAIALTPYVAPPSAPTLSGSTSATLGGLADLSWTAPSGATSYQLYRGVTLIYSSTGTSYTDTAPATSTSYTYTVYATGAGGQSVVSNSVSVTSSGPVVVAVPASGLLNLTIGGTDRTRLILANTLKIQNILTNKRDTCQFSIITHTGQSYKPNLGQEVVVTDTSVKIFGGVIVSMESHPSSFGSVIHTITCQDYTRLLDSKLIAETFTNKTVDYIISYLKTTYFPEHFTTTNVSAPITVEYVAFNYKPLAKCLEDLANLINYDWYVDYNKDLHFFAKESVLAPFNLSDTGGKYRYDSLVIRRDNSQVRNSVIVRGGEYIASQLTTNIQTNGVDAIFPLPYRFSDFAAHLTGHVLTVGVDNTDNPDNYDVLYNFQEKILRFKTADIPSASKTLKVSGKPYLPVIVKYKSSSAIASMVSAETSGTYTSDGVYEYLIVDKTINSKEAARQRAQAEILAYAQTLSEGEFVTETSGLKAGQTITVQSTSRNINETFVINKVVITQFSAQTLLYQVSLITTRTFDLIDVLQRLLLQSTKDIVIDPHEVTDILENFDSTMEMTDSVSTGSYTTGPYLYSPGSPTGRWNFATWS